MADASKWQNYRPSKAVWFWSCVGAVLLTAIVGFTWGGWVTASTAQRMADQAKNELVASICVGSFVDGPDFAKRLTELKDASSWKRAGLIEEGGWVTLAGMEEPYKPASSLCASELAGMEVPTPGSADASQADNS